MPTALPTPNIGTPPDGGRKLTGLHVLLMLLAFFGIVASVNAVMINVALTTFRGEVVKKPYEQGIAYNKDIAESRAQTARGWKVEGAVKRGPDGKAHIDVVAHDAAGVALAGMQVEAILAAPADKKLDRIVKLEEIGAGVYRGETAITGGLWDFELSAVRDGEKQFQSRSRITLD